MKKNIFKKTGLALALAGSLVIGTAAGGMLEKITAYKNYGITIKYDGDVQTMHDVNGKRVYPISYEGTTYVPIRAVSNMMGIDVEWDGPNNTVWLGKTDDYKDFIETCLPYETYDYVNHYRVVDNKSVNICGKTYSNFIVLDCNSYKVNSKLYYNIEGKYTELNFLVYSKYNDTLKIYGDNDELLVSQSIGGGQLPEMVSVDVTDTQQLTVVNIYNSYGSPIYIVDAKIK